jgi:thiosulfate/3-mercaptopyruvate sulfurtransferase
MAEGRSVSTDEPERKSRSARSTTRPAGVRAATADDVAAAEQDQAVVVLDSRGPDQFRGGSVWFEDGPVPVDPDGVARTPRGPIRGGRIPGAVNVPWFELYRPDRTMKSRPELRELFAGAGLEPGCRAITYCGVGLSASALLYALHRAGFEDVALYDASWEEWGRDLRRSVARG